MKHHATLFRSFLIGLVLLFFPDHMVNARGAASFASNPDQDSGWVRAQVVGGGCDNQGNCDSTSTPGSPTLYEYVPDRERHDREPMASGDLSQHGGDHTAVERQACHIGNTYLGWSRGIWHHGATWTLNIINGQRVWTGPTRPHWAFEHDDTCEVLATSTPAATATPVPPTATLRPRGLVISVHRCTSGGALLDSGLVTMTAWAGSWSVSQQTSQLSADVPGQYTQASFSVSVNSAWSITQGRTNATVGLPHNETIVAWNSSCQQQPPTTASPTLPPPRPCLLWHQQWLASIPLMRPRQVRDRNNQIVSLPTSPSGTLPELLPSQTTFEFWNDLGFSFDPDDDWEGGSIVARHQPEFGVSVELANVSTGSTLIGRTGIQEHIWASPHGDWGVLREYPSTGLASAPTRLGTWPGWNAQNWPLYRPIPADQAGIRATFAGRLPEGLYRLRMRSEQIGGNGWTMADWADGAADQNCPLGYRETAFYFRVGTPATPTPTMVGTATPTRTGTVATPTSTPTPTPPPPPTASGDWYLWLHAVDDPDNGVYRSTGSTITWPASMVLDFTPSVDLSLSPPAPPPGSPYAFRSEILGWSFVSSAGKSATGTDSLGRSGCRVRTHPSTSTSLLAGCVYAYVATPTAGDLSPTNGRHTQLGGQAHIYWGAFLPTAQQMASDIYTYQLAQLQPVDLELQLLVRVQVLRRSDGVVVASRDQVLSGTFTVNLNVVRDAYR